MYTPIADQDEKLDIIEHVNQDHLEEVLAITQTYHQHKTITHARIADVFKEGMLVDAETATGSEQLFIPFELEGSLEEQILYLAYLAMAKQGKDLSGHRKHYFEVISKEKHTQNITRMTLLSHTPLPQNYAAYAYAMVLKVLAKTPTKPTPFKNSPITKWIQQFTNRAFLWFLKQSSSQRREKMVKSMNKDIRHYTLRRTWQSDESDFINHCFMDIFTHDDSAGSRWAASLNAGDIIYSRSESKDKHAHLQSGQALLIADETAYPALAGILDGWQNPLPPLVIIVSQHDSEQTYFSDEDLPNNSDLYRIVGNVDTQAAQVIELIGSFRKIDCVWGALESQQAKRIRHYLRNERGLSGRQNHVKAYWRADK